MKRLLLFQAIGMLLAVAPACAHEKVRIDGAGWTEDDRVMEITPQGTKSNIFASRPDKSALPTRLSKDIHVSEPSAVVQK
ncbi:MAG: hypothetical protein K2X93_17005 [Candidatus Obscuribacterales bacterium]|nr:hypothetical protein [Candidatus Obscuribacterales bacterium]